MASRLSTATRYPLDDMRAKKVRGVRQQRGERLRDKTKNKYNIYITQSRCLMQRERVSWKVINKFFILSVAFFPDLLEGSKLSAKKLISVAHAMHRAVNEYPEFREFLNFFFLYLFSTTALI